MVSQIISFDIGANENTKYTFVAVSIHYNKSLPNFDGFCFWVNYSISIQNSME